MTEAAPVRSGDGGSDGAVGRSLPTWLIFAIVLGGLALRLFISPSYGWRGFEGDLIEQKQAMHRSITLGIHQVYTPNAENDPALSGKDWDGSYFINYPPVIVYMRYLTGQVYRHFAPYEFSLWYSELNFYHMNIYWRLKQSRGFTVAAKLPSILGDCLIIVGLFLFVAPRGGQPLALAVSAAYAFNPGIIVDSAHWGQHDSVWVAFLLVSLYWMHRGRLELSWIAYTLAGLTKPQAAAFFFLILGLGLMRFPLRRVVVGGAAALATFALVFLPFLWYGTFVETITAIVVSIFGGEAFVSNFATNFWWLVTAGATPLVSDEIPLLGPLTARHFGMLVFIASSAAVLWRLRRNDESAATLYLGASALGMMFYMFSTELHENHSMVIIPLCGLAIAQHRRVWWPFGLVSLTFFANLVLFDKYPMQPLVKLIGPFQVLPPSLAAAALNFVVLGLLLVFFWKATAHPSARGVSESEG